jgi:pseudouridine-5'-phosphate glycosidase
VACGLPSVGPIRVLATGGIGGVHRGWVDRPDISADLGGLAAAAVCVIASGVKAVLDVPASLEALEALAVPVIAFGTDRFPQFYGSGSDELPAPGRLDDARAVAELCRTHWETLGRRTGVLVANPVPEPYEIEQAELDRLVAEVDARARPRRGPTGPQRTPWLLGTLAGRTGGRVVDANVALLVSNARLAARVAGALTGL